MEKIITLQGFDVAGIQIRTTNKLAIDSNSIGKLWDLFFETYLNKITNRIDDNIIALYHNYETDRNGFYTLLIGYRVKPILNKLPQTDNLVHTSVPDQQYVVFESQCEKNKVLKTWQKIWQCEDEKTINRKYGYDYEIYFSKDSTMEIHISI